MSDIYTLGRYVIAQELDKGNYLGTGSKQVKIENKKEWESILNLLEKAKGNISLDALIKEDEISSSPGSLSFLLKENFIIKATDWITDSRYSRTYYYYQSIGLDVNEAERKLFNSSVTVLGCGGIGNHISAALVSNGIGNINLVDGDHIELSNLTRQILFDENNVGDRKVDVLAKRLKERNSECKIQCYDMHINSEEDLKKLPKSDLIVLSADSENIVDIVNRFCVKNKIPYVNVCYMNDIAVWGPFYIPGETGCHSCGCLRLRLKEIECSSNKRNIDYINNDFKSATFPPINATASALATSDIIRFLAGSKSISSKDLRIGLHDITLKVERQDFSKNELCSVCNPKP